MLCVIPYKYPLSSVRWSSLSGLTLWRLRGSRSSLLMTLTGTTPGLVRDLVCLVKSFSSINFNVQILHSIRFLIFFNSSIHCKEDLPEARDWCRWLPEDLRWPPEEWLPPTTLLQEQWCHFTQHPAAAAEDGHHWCRSQGVFELLYPFLLLTTFSGCGSLLIGRCVAVEGSSPPKEGVIWTKWLEGLLLKLEQSHLRFHWCHVWWLRWLHFICTLD